MKPLILVTNDDGYFSEGIETLSVCLKEHADVIIVAPDREKSATSLSLTLRRPLRVQKIKEDVYSVDGTPADCVYLAVKKFLPRRPDLLASGINRGPNLGQQDISYSGTVAAAVQGTFLRIPSIAFSLLPDDSGKFHYVYASKIGLRLAKKILEFPLPGGVTLNINIPPPPARGFKVTKLGEKRYDPEVIEKKDPRGYVYYWLGTGVPEAIGDDGSDIRATKAGYISVTPLHTDLTDYKTLQNHILERILPADSDEMA